MGWFVGIVAFIFVVAVMSILLVAQLSFPIGFAVTISTLTVAVITAIVRYWPKWER